MKRFRNYIGLLRLYSLADLVLMLIALQAGTLQFIGAILLHLAFLAHLESRHSHPYREKVPNWISYALAIIGVIAYGKIEGLIYLFFSFLYTQKSKSFGSISSLFRGFQSLFIITGIIGYHSPLPYIAAALLSIRNLGGDFRDTEKDKKEGMITLPVLIGIKRNVLYIHLILTILTSIFWWYLSPLSIIWIIVVIIIQISSYNLTTR